MNSPTPTQFGLPCTQVYGANPWSMVNFKENWLSFPWKPSTLLSPSDGGGASWPPSYSMLTITATVGSSRQPSCHIQKTLFHTSSFCLFWDGAWALGKGLFRCPIWEGACYWHLPYALCSAVSSPVGREDMKLGDRLKWFLKQQRTENSLKDVNIQWGCKHLKSSLKFFILFSPISVLFWLP